MTDRLRVLLLAPGCNPESITGALEGYSLAAALSHLHAVTLVIGPATLDPVRRARAPFERIEVVSAPRIERLESWLLRRLFKFNYRSQAWTAVSVPFSIAFELRAWRQLRRRIEAGEFDVILRLLPINTVCPSPFPRLLRRCGVPFVLGPLNGGLPWPPGFSQAKRQMQWISPFRPLFRHLPFARSTFRHAAGVVAGSTHTFNEVPAGRSKVFFVPTNGLAEWVFAEKRPALAPTERLEMVFAGALVPFKGCDLALRGAAPLLRQHRARFTIFGQGPDRARLDQLASELGVASEVVFAGQVSHREVLAGFRSADVFLFPSVHDWGGAVVIEAMASGAVPIVADFGGPGDSIHAGVGFKVPLESEDGVVAAITGILDRLAGDRPLLAHLRRQGMAYAGARFSWDAKAREMTRILAWAAGQAPRPDLLPPGAASDLAAAGGTSPAAAEAPSVPATGPSPTVR